MTLPPLFSKALPVLKKIEEHGFEAYFVGGCVRDFIIGREISDVDIATSATPEEIKTIFSHTVDVGIEHGTVMVLYSGNGYEITTFRSESTYSDFRRPDDVQFVRELEEDLKRRDFTMNAMAMNTHLTLIDLFNGKQDLQNQLIRTVGCPKERFQEDALRMLRGARFASQLAFTIDEDTLLAMATHSHLLKHVAVERKRMEMDKLLKGSDYLLGLHYLHSTSLVNFIPSFPLDNQALDRLKKIDIKSFSIEQSWAAMIIVFDIADPAGLLKEWRHSNKRIDSINKLLRFYQIRKREPWNSEMLFRAGKSLAHDAEELFAAIHQKESEAALINQLWATLPIKNRAELVVNGQTLIDWCDKSSGPWIGKLLSEIETLVIRQQLKNDHNDIKKWVDAWLQK